MYRSIIILNILLSNHQIELKGQKSYNGLSEIIQIQGVSWKLPDDSLFLVAKKKALSSNILLLCETDHGHGTSLDAQSRLLRSLIDSSDIKVLYIEANWMNCEIIMETLEREKSNGIITSEKYMQSIELKYWVRTGFWDYLARKIIEGRIILRGIDIDGLSPVIAKELYKEAILIPKVDSFLQSNQGARKDVSFVFDSFEGINSSSFFYFEDFNIRISSFIGLVLSHYRNESNNKRIKQWESIHNLFYWIYKRGEVTKQNKIANVIANDKQLTSFHLIRDSLMAETFLSYNISDSAYRVACSVSSYHGLRNSLTIESIEDCCKSRSDRTMFEIVENRVSNRKIYSICFVTATGYFGVCYLPGEKTMRIKKPHPKSIENYLYKKNLDYCFVELYNTNNRSKFYMNVVYNKYLISDWGNNYSSVFFIRSMKPTKLFFSPVAHEWK